MPEDVDETVPPTVPAYGEHGLPSAGGPPIPSGYEPIAPDLPAVNVLDQLRADLAADGQGPRELRLLLKRDPRYVVVYSLDLSGDEIDQADRYAGGAQARQRSQYSMAKYSAMIAALKCVRIEREGVTLLDDEQRPLRFAHRWLMASVLDPASHRPVNTAAECARHFYRDDADLDAAVRTIWTDSGWAKDAEVAPSDPRDGGSGV